jgi:hypothetical protein
MDVPDGELELGPPTVGDRRATGLDELAVEGTVETMVLVARAVERGRRRGADRLQDGTEVQLACLPVVVDRDRGVEALDMADGFGHRAEAERS